MSQNKIKITFFIFSKVPKQTPRQECQNIPKQVPQEQVSFFQ